MQMPIPQRQSQLPEGDTMESQQSAGGAGTPTSWYSSPWTQLVFGVICMAMIANMQYGWTLFVNPIDDKYHWGRTAIQVVGGEAILHWDSM